MSEQFSTTQSTDFDQLLDQGFSPEEAARLTQMKEHLDDQIEYREIVVESRRLTFIRWLIEHNRMEQQ